jgi:hypothetical protein
MPISPLGVVAGQRRLNILARKKREQWRREGGGEQGAIAPGRAGGGGAAAPLKIFLRTIQLCVSKFHAKIYLSHSKSVHFLEAWPNKLLAKCSGWPPSRPT